MKELKFRAWDENKKRYDGSFLIDKLGNTYDVSVEESETKACCAVVGKPNLVIEQYTGLKDKNGDKEIYEGDIVEYTTCYYGNEKRHRKVVEWKEWDSDDFGEPHNLGYSNLSECMEVIGNVHENADLLDEICD